MALTIFFFFWSYVCVHNVENNFISSNRIYYHKSIIKARNFPFHSQCWLLFRGRLLWIAKEKEENNNNLWYMTLIFYLNFHQTISMTRAGIFPPTLVFPTLGYCSVCRIFCVVIAGETFQIKMSRENRKIVWF